LIYHASGTIETHLQY